MSVFKRHQCLDGFCQTEIQELALDTVSRILKIKQSPVRTQTKVQYAHMYMFLALNCMVIFLLFDGVS
jgi:hypothetical protein